jgi:hypothetical protein
MVIEPNHQYLSNLLTNELLVELSFLGQDLTPGSSAARQVVEHQLPALRPSPLLVGNTWN